MTALEIAGSAHLLEIGRRAVEEELVELRDARISVLRRNGLVIRENDGRASDVIRLGVEHALRIALVAIVESQKIPGVVDDMAARDARIRDLENELAALRARLP